MSQARSQAPRRTRRRTILSSAALRPALAVSHPCVVPWSAEAGERHAAGWRFPLVDERSGAGRSTLHLSVIEPGQAAHLPHRHPGEEIMFLLEGTGEFTVGRKRHRVGAMTALFCPEHVRHGLRNVGAGRLRYVVFRVKAEKE